MVVELYDTERSYVEALQILVNVSTLVGVTVSSKSFSSLVTETRTRVFPSVPFPSPSPPHSPRVPLRVLILKLRLKTAVTRNCANRLIGSHLYMHVETAIRLCIL